MITPLIFPSVLMVTRTATTSKEFLSIKAAAERYQKAQITIRRFVRTMLEKERNTDRALIKPLPKEALDLKKKHRPFSYTIAVDLLEKHFGLAAPAVKQSAAPDDVRSLLEKTNMALTDQLKVKDEQIRVLAQAIDDLSERQRETNILMKNLQERLLLAAPQQDIVEAEATKSTPAKYTKKKRWWKLFS